jgi:type I restriction enzyme M protein
VLDKENAAARKGIFMIDASKGFIKDGNKNRLRAQDIHKIVDTFTRQAEIPRYARIVPVAEISDPKNDFNLNLPRYIDSTEPEDIQDIDAHLHGGIQDRDIDAPDRYWQVIPGVRTALFKEANRPGYSQLKLDHGQLPEDLSAKGVSPAAASIVNTPLSIKESIFSHAEFTAYNKSVTRLFAKWQAANTPFLKGIDQIGKPKSLIETLSEDLLITFEKARLLDPYDVYQHLMDYWAEIMQDDVYMIVSDGWREAARPRLIIEEKGGKTKEKPDFTVGKLKYKAELIPTELVIARYFDVEQETIEKLENKIAATRQSMEEMAEEHSGEEGLLESAKNDKDKLTKASVAARLKEIKGDPDAADERKMLGDYLALIEKEAAITAKVKAAQEALMAKVAAQYGKLTEDEIKTLVVDDKWLARLAAVVQGELDRVSQTLTGRIRELAERYATPLPRLVDEVVLLSSRVDKHLKKMGFQP